MNEPHPIMQLVAELESKLRMEKQRNHELRSELASAVIGAILKPYTALASGTVVGAIVMWLWCHWR